MVTELSLPIESSVVSRRFSSTHCLAGESIDVLMDDLKEAMAEVAYLTSNLILGCDAAELDNPVALSLAAKVRDFEHFCRRRFDFIERAASHSELEQTRASLQKLRREYLVIKSTMREAFRERAHVLSCTDWQSPVYASSSEFTSNRLNAGISEHQLDYKRDGHLEAAEYEVCFVNEYVLHLDCPVKAKAYLTNSGMAAYSTVLHWLAHELKIGDCTLAIEPMYFENIHLAGGYFPDLLRVQTPSSQNLLEQLRRNQPTVVLADAITNCNDVLAHDIETILAWACSETTEQTAVVIDTTCVPTVLLPEGLLKNIPEHVLVIFIESLAKHHQFGMDAVTGGVVVLHGNDKLHDSFRKTRARFGGNITDVSAASLPEPNKLQLKTRMNRHSRNVRLLVERVQDKIEGHSGIIESFSWMADPASFAPQFHGSCLTIHLKEQFKSVNKYRQFEHQVIQLAKQRNLPLALSTSFGFDITRLYVTAPSTPFEPPFLRVAIGTETVEEIEILSEIIASIHRQLALIWKPLTVPKESPRLELAPVVKIRHAAEDSSLLKYSVFCGENALKQYLSPANYQKTPLVELPPDLNPYCSQGVRIFAKIMPLVPLMNIKSIPAYSMLSKAAERGELNGIDTVIESSSGNTVLSLSVIARMFGIDETRAIVDHSIAPALLRMLRLFGIEVMLHPGPGHELYNNVQPRSERARELGSQQGWLNPGQYSNQDNPAGFGKWLAPDLWSQTSGKLAVLSGALGTCGTIYGISTELRKRNPSLQVIACCPQPGQAVPGPRERSQLVDVAFPWQDAVNVRMELTAEESFAASVKLLRRGIMGGPSSGMNYAGLLRYIDNQKESGQLEQMLQGCGELTCVFLCCDSPLAHVDEYFDALGDEYFSRVHHFTPEEPHQSL